MGDRPEPQDDRVRRLKSNLESLLNRMTDGRGCSVRWYPEKRKLSGSYRNWDVHKEFDRQSRQNIKRCRENGQERIESAPIISQYDDLIDEIVVYHGDKNYFDVNVCLVDDKG